MRRCPTCNRTFEGNLKFCQADGTPLVEEGQAADDPLKTRVGMPLPIEEPAVEEQYDPMKTMMAPPPKLDSPPPSPFSDAGSQQSPPASADLKTPSFGDLGSPQFDAGSNNPPSGGFGQTPSGQFGQSPSDQFGNQPSAQFGNQPSGGFGDAPRAPTFQEPEPNFGNPGFGQQPFGQSPAEWSPPPAPNQEWGNQGLGQNTPFAPPAGASGQNQTLPIVSLITGILSVVCCYISIITGPTALITGYLGMTKAKQDPTNYGGRVMAIVGMALGGLGLLILVAYFAYIILVVGLSAAAR